MPFIFLDQVPLLLCTKFSLGHIFGRFLAREHVYRFQLIGDYDCFVCVAIRMYGENPQGALCPNGHQYTDEEKTTHHA